MQQLEHRIGREPFLRCPGRLSLVSPSVCRHPQNSRVPPRALPRVHLEDPFGKRAYHQMRVRCLLPLETVYRIPMRTLRRMP